MNNDKIKAIKKDIEETQKIMEKNIDDVITRGQKLELLRDRSEELSERSAVFLQSATHLRRKVESRYHALTSTLLAFGLIFTAGLLAGFPTNLSLLAGFVGAVLSYYITQGLFSFSGCVKDKASNWLHRDKPKRTISFADTKPKAQTSYLPRYKKTKPKQEAANEASVFKKTKLRK